MGFLRNIVEITVPFKVRTLLNPSYRRFNRLLTKIYMLFHNRHGLFKQKKNVSDERIIVSMTSWRKRINNVEYVVKSILDNTITPYKIICNLSSDEFPGKDNELPASLTELLKNQIFEINWVKDNTKAFKKFIPTLKKYPDDIIITIDDDFLYPVDFIETFYKKHIEFPNVPLSGNNVIINNANFHCGCASLVKADFFGKYIDLLYDWDVVQLGSSDVFYTYCAALNGYYYKNVGKLFFINMIPICPNDALSENGELLIEQMIILLESKIYEKFRIDISDINRPRLSIF